MANYIRTTDNTYPHSETSIKRNHPDTSFPEIFRPLPEYQVVFPAPAPVPSNPITQIPREIAPVLTDKGHYEQAWEIVDKFVEYTDDQGVLHTKAEQEQTAIATDQASKLSNLVKGITDATQTRLDDFARTRNYDGILSACTYAYSAVPKFAAEGQYCVNTRDNTWATLYTIMGEVEAGTRPMPSGFSDIESDLPVLVWPI